ncbi:hypothetical protein VCUG_00563 [Vavraia culicis subsp. floridensis]|uniref:Gluconate transport-inducing protein n=1 Tax=Vavraia culicis (isolate floridensis) TaxID=948595 RepID=L2GY15_VAVCU|nr:uncharacterized protein VCUG_00563 [Vavraia culicis subsp. floridensis]ELA47980.1 hypothetical protein VCUG_00563 [Vavraia culicis subsp. floridensis]
MTSLRGYLHTYEEAYQIVHSVRLGIIAPLSKRLSIWERTSIKSGSIFVFIRDCRGILRWTDGRLWSSSKITGPFLLYKEETRHFCKKFRKKHLTDITRPLKNIPLGKQMEQNKFILYKKTISIRHEQNVYHIIAYFQPVFDKWSLGSTPFFRSMKIVIGMYGELSSDRYLDNLKRKNVDIHTRYKLLSLNSASILPDIDRKLLERIAREVLMNKLTVSKTSDVFKTNN